MAREYAFLMIDYDMPDLIKDIQNKLTDNELYTEIDNDDYGLEKETHVTLVPCLDNDINLDELKKMLEPIDKYALILNNISMFTNNEKYDVLKCDAHSMVLLDTNGKIREKFPTYSEYNEYHPHVTIGYLKKGVGEKYIKDMLSPLVVLKPKCFNFSYHDNDGNNKNIRFTK